MHDSVKPRGDVLPVSPERETEIWKHFIGLYIDRFTDANRTIDIDALRACLKIKLGPLFHENADRFEAALQALSGTTRAELLSVLTGPLQELRTQSHESYPTFELELRVLNQEQNGFTSLTANRMVSYQMNDGCASLHIQPSYSIADKGGTLEEGLRSLAQELEQPALAYVTHIGIDSWLVTSRPERWKELGFRIKSDRPTFACMSVEEFKKRWSSSNL